MAELREMKVGRMRGVVEKKDWGVEKRATLPNVPNVPNRQALPPQATSICLQRILGTQ